MNRSKFVRLGGNVLDMSNFLTVVILSLVVLINFQNSCSNSAITKNESGDKRKMISGNFSAQTSGPGFIKLEIKADGAATFLNVSTIHLPPVELERLVTKLERANDGSLCFVDKPKTVEPCLVSADETSVVVKLIPDGKTLKLEKTEEK